MFAKKVFFSSVWSFTSGSAYQIVNLVIFIGLSRLLNADIFGQVAMALVYVELFCVFSKLGFTQAVIQKPTLCNEDTNSAFWGAALLGIISTSFLLAFGNDLAALADGGSYNNLIIYLAPLPLFAAVSTVPEALLQRDHNFKSLAYRTIVSTTISGMIGLVLAFNGFGVYSLVIQRLSSESIKLLLLWWYAGWKPSTIFSVTNFKSLLKFSLPLVGTSIIFNLANKYRDFMIGYMLGVSALGYFRITAKLFHFIVQVIISPFVQVSLTTFSRLNDDKERLTLYYLKFIQIICLISFPAFIGVSIVADESIVLLFGEKWLPSASYLQILAFVGLVTGINYMFVPLQTSLNRPKNVLKYGLIAAAITTAIITYTTAVSMEMVYYGFIASEYINTLIYMFVIANSLNFSMNRYIKCIVPGLCASAIMAGALLLYKSYFTGFDLLIFDLSMLVVLGITIYTATITMLFPRVFNELIRELRKIIY